MNRRSFISLLTAALSRAQDVPGRAGFTVAGVVVNALTNAPINRALVTLASSINRQQSQQVVTGSDGRFSFADLAAHRFELTVTRSSGAPQAYLAHGGFSSAIVTGPDQDTANLIFRFHTPGRLAGTVVDESNEPVQNASIHLYTQVVDQQGMRRLTQSQSNMTRLSGQFRFAHLNPGSYILAVNAHPWFSQPIYQQRTFVNGGRRTGSAVDPQFDVAYPVTYYPSGTDAQAATPVSIAEGNETVVQVSLRAVPAIHVRVTGGDQRPDVGTSIQVSALGPEGQIIPLNVGVFIQGGQGELSGIAPGRYQVTASSFSAPARAQMQGFSPPEEFMASRPGFSRKLIDLVDGGVVDLSSNSRISVTAAVKLANNDRAANRIGLLLRDARTGTAVRSIAGPDDTLRFPEANLFPGRFTLLSNTPAFHIVSLEAKGAKVSGNEIAIEDNSEVQLTVLIGRRSSVKVDGFAVRDKRPVVGAMVLLLPMNTVPGAPIYQDQSNSDGSFTFSNVSGGKYVAVAVDDGQDLAFGEPSVIKPYLTTAVSIAVDEAGSPPVLMVPVQQRTR